MRRLVDPDHSGLPASVCCPVVHATSMQRGAGRKQRGSIYSKPGVSTRRQQGQQAEQHGVGQPLHDIPNPRKRPHSPVSVTTTPLDDEFDEIGSAALSDYEMSQHQDAGMPAPQQQGHESHPPTLFHPSSANLPPPAALHYNLYTTTTTSSASMSTSSGSGQVTASVRDSTPSICDPAPSASSTGASITQIKSGSRDDQQSVIQLENERYRYLGEVKTLRDQISHMEKFYRDREQEQYSRQETQKSEQASKEKEYRCKLEQLTTQLEFFHKELTDEREKRKAEEEKRKAAEEKLSHLSGGSSAEPVKRVPPQVVKVKRPKQQFSPPSGSLSAFPSTASFMESPRLVSSTPLQCKRPREINPVLSDVDSKSGMQLTTEAHNVTPNPSPLLAARVAHKSVQTPSQSTSLLSVSSSSAVQVTLGHSFVVPHSEGDAFLVDTVQSDGRSSGAELLQRLVQWDGQENKAAMDGSTDHQDKVVFLPEEDALSPSMEEEEEVEEMEKGDTHGVPPVQPEGFFSLLTCPNPFFIASTSKPIDALMSPRQSASSTSVKRKAVLKENTSLVKVAILQSIGRKRRLAASEDSESSSSDDSGPVKASLSGNMSPFLLNSASHCQLQECVMQLLASAGVPHTASASVELCTPLQFAGQHNQCSPVPQHSEEDQGLPLLYFLQSRIIAYCQECSVDNSQQGENGDSPLTSPESSVDSLAGSGKGSNGSALSSEGGGVDFSAPLLQLLKTLLLLVQHSPRARERICERPPHLVYDSIPSRPGSRSSMHSQSESSSGSKDGSIELLSQKSSSDLSDQSSSRMESSGSQTASQLGLAEGDIRTPPDRVWMPHPSMSKVYVDFSSFSTTASTAHQPSFSSSEHDLSIDVMHHISLTAQFFPLLLHLAGPPWVRGDGESEGCG